MPSAASPSSTPGTGPRPIAPPGHPMEQVIGHYFGASEPGTEQLHHLVVARRVRNAFGLPDLKTAVYAIAPVGDGPAEAEDFIAQSIIGAVLQAHAEGGAWGAAFTLEAIFVDASEDEVTDNRARRMHADGRLEAHPDAYEQTLLYAVCADGRRWIGRHVLTGPYAGTFDGPHLLQGPPTSREDMPYGRLVRALVGLPF